MAASLQAPTLFTIAQDLTKMQVETSVDEADIGRIKVEDRATFTVDAFPGETFSGTVTQIRKAALIVQNVVTYTVVIAVDNPGGRLLPGMTANVKLVVAEKPSVLKVSNAALRFRPAGDDRRRRPRRARRAGRGAASGDRPELEQIRERLVQSLKLTEAQQRKLDPILEESREPDAGPRRRARGQERQARAQKIREATRARIREILTPDQQARYDQEGGAARRGRRHAGTRLDGRTGRQPGGRRADAGPERRHHDRGRAGRSQGRPGRDRRHRRCRAAAVPAGLRPGGPRPQRSGPRSRQ